VRAVLSRRRFGLSPAEIELCLLSLAPHVVPSYGRVCAHLQGDVSRTRPTLGLAIRLFDFECTSPWHVRQLLAPEARLIREHLLSVRPAEDPLLSELALRRAVVQHLLGTHVAQLAGTPLADCDVAALFFGEEERSAVSELAAGVANAASSGEPLFADVRGPEGVGKRSLVAALATRFAKKAFFFEFRAADAAGARDLEEWLLRVRLADGWPVIELVDNALAAEAGRAIEASNVGCAFLLAEQPRRGAPERGRRWMAVDLDTPPASTRRDAWIRFLDREGLACERGDVALTASIFPFTPGQISRVCKDVAERVQSRRASRIVSGRLLNAVSRDHCDHRLAEMAERLPTSRTWDDLVLGGDEIARLREVANAVRTRARVMEEWNFRAKLDSSPGITVLFSGPSGTGKTMAASILGNDLGMDVYRVDLSRTVSKYIGDTEKNLDHLFIEAARAHAIVFFDEAEAVFGKRSEVKDAHDRYANMEIAYLLQRMEAYDGVAILATNLRNNIDNAFLRRLQFAVEFSPPAEDQRLRIWQGIWLENAELDGDVDLPFLASSFVLTGGHVRNIAVAAAYLAARTGDAIAMRHLIVATCREFQKLGHVCVAGQFGPYAGLLPSEVRR
jgi:ATP-dependent 26S proteasome regulatory subunit